MPLNRQSRRAFLGRTSMGLGSLALASLLAADGAYAAMWARQQKDRGPSPARDPAREPAGEPAGETAAE